MKPNKEPFTKEEKEIMDLLVEAHNKFSKIEKFHDAELFEWIEGIHKCQTIMMNRVVTRDYPDYFYHKK